MGESIEAMPTPIPAINLDAIKNNRSGDSAIEREEKKKMRQPL